MKVLYDIDADLPSLEGSRFAVISYGSQGHAQALNLRDSFIDVGIGLRAVRAGRRRLPLDCL
ncbi:hypothetical protein [Pseudomonas fluorescens]